MNDKEAIIYSLRQELYKKSFYEFVKRAVKEIEPNTNWDWNWHIEYLCDLMEDHAIRVYNGDPGNANVCINIPFRSMKSLIVATLFNCWLWTWFPTAKVMCISFSESLAIRHAYLGKILMRSNWYKDYFPDVQLMTDDSQKGAYTNTYGGTRLSFGLTAGITGAGSDFQIVDDGNRVNESKKQLENANVNYDEMVFNRVNDPNNCMRLNLQQRVNANDLSGHLLSKGGWEHINLPAVLDKTIRPVYLADNYTDNLFWASRFNREVLQQYHTALGSRAYNAQLLQRTSSDGGNIFKQQWFDIVEYDEKVHKNLSWDCIVDPSYTSKQTNDPTGIMIVSKFGHDIIVKKVYAVRKEFPDLIKHLIDVCSTYGIKRIYIEPKASGLSIIQQLRRSTRLNVVELPNQKDDKETRANAVSPSVESRRVKLLDGSYIKDFIDEVINFPLAAHDDMTDCLIYAIEKFVNKRAFNYKI